MASSAIENLPLIHGEIADYRFDGRILYSYSKPVLRTVGNIYANVELVREITGGKRVPLLIYLSKSPVPDTETRKFSVQQLPVIYKAMAMVSNAGISQIIMNILFRLSPPPIPMKSFKDDLPAIYWLQSFVSVEG